MNDFNRLYSDTLNLISQCNATCQRSRRERQDIDSKINRDLRDADAEIRAADRDLTAVQSLINGLATFLDRCVADNSQICRQLQLHFNEADRHCQGIEKARKQGKVISRKLDTAWDDSNSTLDIFNNGLKRWADQKDETDQMCRAMDLEIHSLIMEFKSLGDAMDAVYGIINDILSDNFVTVSKQISNMEIEAFLADSEERLMKFRMATEKKEKELDKIILEMEMRIADEADRQTWEEMARQASDKGREAVRFKKKAIYLSRKKDKNEEKA